MLSSINYKPESKQAPLTTWHEFIRRVTYHVPKVTKQHELKLLPPLQALLLHSKMANYVLKLAVSVTILSSPFLHCFEQFGWHTSNESVQITWDNNNVEETMYSSSEEDSDGQEGQSEVPVISREEQDQMADTDSDGAL